MIESERSQRRLSAQRVERIAPSGTMAVSQKVRELQARGVEVINMGGGDPDFATPPHVVEAAMRSLRDGATHYVESPGLGVLREAIAAKLARENAVQVSTAGIVVTPGAKFAILLTLLSHLDPGDEVLIPQPSWVSYDAMVRLADATAVPVPTFPDTGFRLTDEALARAVTPRTRAIIINHPVNPTGRALQPDEIAAIAAIAEREDLLVVSDEIYEGVRLEDDGHESLAARPELAGRTITINGFSKTYAMTGWRLGYAAGPDPLMASLRKVQQHSVYCVAPFVQQAGVAALTGPQACVAEMCRAYRERRDAFIAAVGAIPGLQVTPPRATFYMFPRIEPPMPGSKRLAQLLLEAGVAGTAGVEFGPTGEGHLRFTLRVSADVMPRVADAIREMLLAARESGESR